LNRGLPKKKGKEEAEEPTFDRETKRIIEQISRGAGKKT